jgi:hypothetical protein
MLLLTQYLKSEEVSLGCCELSHSVMEFISSVSRFEVFMAVIIEYIVFWFVAPSSVVVG